MGENYMAMTLERGRLITLPPDWVVRQVEMHTHYQNILDTLCEGTSFDKHTTPILVLAEWYEEKGMTGVSKVIRDIDEELTLLQ